MKIFNGKITLLKCRKCKREFESLEVLKYCQCCEYEIGYNVKNPMDNPPSGLKDSKECWECGSLEGLVPHDLGGYLCKDCY